MPTASLQSAVILVLPVQRLRARRSRSVAAYAKVAAQASGAFPEIKESCRRLPGTCEVRSEIALTSFWELTVGLQIRRAQLFITPVPKIGRASCRERV